MLKKHRNGNMSLVAKSFLCFFFGTVGAFAQLLPLSVGIKGGVPLTDFVVHGGQPPVEWYSPSKNYIVGGTVELRLPFHLSVEADALYRPIDIFVGSPGQGNTSTKSMWEFPLLAKYHVSFPFLSPYVEAGPSFRTQPDSLGFISTKGFTAGVGTDVHALFLRVSPEVRYTRWGADGTENASYLNTRTDQVEFLVGLSF